MLIRDEDQKRLEAVLKEEFRRVNTKDTGRPLSLSEMEDIVTDVGRRFQESLLESMVKEDGTRISTEKKTVRHAGEPGSARASDPGR